jgi:hypothetical protein
MGVFAVFQDLLNGIPLSVTSLLLDRHPPLANSSDAKSNLNDRNPRFLSGNNPDSPQRAECF